MVFLESPENIFQELKKKTNSGNKIRRTTIKIDSNDLIIENSINLWIGNGWHCVIYPIDRKTLNIVLVSIKIPNFENYSNPILKKLCDVNWYVSDIINNFDGPTYCFENIALIGDSAHPFPPHLAQGGAQTFEDSIVLYESLLKFGLSNAMLLNYSNERASKVKKIMQYSTYAGNILSLKGGNSIVRNKLIEFSGPLINNYLKRLWSF